MTRVALATCAALPRLDAAERLVVGELERRGADVALTVWDDPAVDWDAFDLVVVRSTWDYTDRREAFVRWAGRVPRLANPAPVIAWNTDKRYLGELAAAGLPVVPTAFVAPGEPPPPAPPTADVVVKPTVSADARDTVRLAAGEHAALAAHVARLHAGGRTAMVQPYLDAVDAAGETALLSFDGRLSHAIRKGPLLERGTPGRAGRDAAPDIAPRVPSEAELDVGARTLAAVAERFGTPLYARVDLLPGPDGPTIVEVELTEPSLFLDQAAGAAARLAEAILARAAALTPR